MENRNHTKKETFVWTDERHIAFGFVHVGSGRQGSNKRFLWIHKILLPVIIFLASRWLCVHIKF